MSPSSALLEELHDRLEDDGIPHAIIREPDEPYNGHATAVGISPTTDRERIRRYVAHFALLK
jgi:hypothetical protein